MFTIHDIPFEYKLPLDVSEQLQEVYSCIGHTNFVNASPILKIIFNVNSRQKLLKSIHSELLGADDNAYQAKLTLFKREYNSHVQSNLNYPLSWDSDNCSRYRRQIATDHSRNLFLRRCSSIGSLSDAMEVLISEMSFVDSVMEYLLSLKFEVITRLDNNNTIDHPLIREWKVYFKENPVSVVRYGYNLEKQKAQKDDISLELTKRQHKSRSLAWTQRVLREMQIAHENGWYIVFDTLSLGNHAVKDFYENKTALRDYFRTIGRSINSECGESSKSSFSHNYKYFCVPEYGSQEGRLHYHVVHLLRKLPKGCTDPNINARVRNRREIRLFKNFWSYGFSSPIAVRYSGDRFSRDGWLWPTNEKNVAIEAKPWQAVAYYVTKYVTKKAELDVQRTNQEQSKWNKKLKSVLGYIPKHNFRIRATRGFGLNLPSMSKLSIQCLIQLTNLPFDVTPYPKVIAKSAKNELTLRFKGCMSLSDIVQVRKEPTNLLLSLRKVYATLGCLQKTFLEVMSTMTKTLHVEDISNESISYLRASNSHRETFKAGYKQCFGGK